MKLADSYPSTIRVRVEVSVDIDVDAWARDYGIDRTEVRADVKQYADSLVREHFKDMGVLA